MWIDWLQANALEAVGASQALRLDRIASAGGVSQSTGSQQEQQPPQQQQPVQQTAPGQQQQQQAAQQHQRTDVQAPNEQPPQQPQKQTDVQAANDQPPQQPQKQTRERHRHRRDRQPGPQRELQEARPADAASPAGGKLSADAPAWMPSAVAGWSSQQAHSKCQGHDAPAGSGDVQEPVMPGDAAQHGALDSMADSAAAPDRHGSSGPGVEGPRTPDELCMQLMLFDAARSYALFRQVRHCLPLYIPAPALSFADLCSVTFCD